MSYSELLKEKGLTIEQLSKTILTKIEALENAKSKVADFESEEDLDAKDEREIKKVKKKVEELESEVYKAILKFDPENYKKRLEILEKAKVKRMGRPKKEVSSAPAPVVAMTQPEQHLEELKEEVEVIPEELEEELCEDCLDDLRNGRLSVEDIRAKQEEDEEFEKVSNAKPRKLSKSVIIMGIGAFILTWGAVNFFRERRG